MLYNRGHAAKTMHLAGKRAIRAHLGGRVVWDGTASVVLQAPRLEAVVSAYVPTVSGAAKITTTRMSATAVAYAPVAKSTVAPVAPVVFATAVMRAPAVSATSAPVAPRMNASLIVLAPYVSESFDRTVNAVRIDASAVAYVPAVAANYAAAVPRISATVTALAPMVTATGTAVVNVPLIAANVTAYVPAVKTTAGPVAPRISATATAYVPVARADSGVVSTRMAATATAYVPFVEAINYQPPAITATTTTGIPAGNISPTVDLSTANVGDTWVLVGTYATGAATAPSGWTIASVITGSSLIASHVILTRTKVAGDAATVTVNIGSAQLSAWRCLTVAHAGNISLGGNVRGSSASTIHPTPSGIALAADSLLIRMGGHMYSSSTGDYTWPGTVNPYPVSRSGGSPLIPTLGVASQVAGSVAVIPAVNAAPAASCTYSTATIVIAGINPATPFATVSVNKNGDSPNLGQNTWVPLTAWTADAAGSVTVADEVRVNGTGAATIEVGTQWPIAADNKNVRVTQNGVIVWTMGAGQSLNFTNTFPLNVVDGDILTVEAWTSAGTAARQIVKGGTGTYLRVIPA